MTDASMQHVVHVGDLDVKVQVSDRRRSIRLTVERDATVTAVIPPGNRRGELAKVINAKRPWLYAKLRERADTRPAPPAKAIRDRRRLSVPRPQLPAAARGPSTSARSA